MNRILAKATTLLLAAVMLLTLSPTVTTVAIAAQITSKLDFVNVITSDDSGNGWVWAQGTKTLTLDGFYFNVTRPNSPGEPYSAILLPAGSIIVLNGNNSIDTMDFANSIEAQGDLAITGSGTLTVTADKSYGSWARGISTNNGDITIDAGSVKINVVGYGIWAYNGGIIVKTGTVKINSVNDEASMSCGMCSSMNVTIDSGANVIINTDCSGIRTTNGNAIIDDATLDITSTKYGIVSERGDTIITGSAKVTINTNNFAGIQAGSDVIIGESQVDINAIPTNPDFYMPDGIYAGSNLSIESGAKVSVESVYGIGANDTVSVADGSDVIILTDDDGLYADNQIIISGGDVIINTLGDYGISAENITISGGSVDIDAGLYGISADNGDITINGGTINILADYIGIGADGGDIALSGGSGNIKVLDNEMSVLSVNGSIITENGIAVKGWDDSAYIIPSTIKSYIHEWEEEGTSFSATHSYFSSAYNTDTRLSNIRFGSNSGYSLVEVAGVTLNASDFSTESVSQLITASIDVPNSTDSIGAGNVVMSNGVDYMAFDTYIPLDFLSNSSYDHASVLASISAAFGTGGGANSINNIVTNYNLNIADKIPLIAGGAKDFYILTSNGDYFKITVNRAADTTSSLSSAKDIIMFNIPGQVGATTVNGTAISLTMPYGTNLTSLTPIIYVSAGASINPASGEAQNFTDSVTYTVTAEDTTTKVYAISVAAADSPSIYAVSVIGSHASASGEGNYATGSTVAINAGSRSNYTFTGWTTSSSGVIFANSNNAATTFKMPANTVTVTANWSYNGGTSGGSSTNAANPPTSAQDLTQPPFTGKLQGTINGIPLDYIKNEDGSVSLLLTANDIEKYPRIDNSYVIEVKEQNNVTISIPISALGDASVLIIKIDFGTVTLSKKMLESYSSLYGDILEISLKKGSFVVELLHNGKPVIWNDTVNPLFVGLPSALAADTTINGYVAVKKEASGNVIIPYSVYKNGDVICQIADTGTFDVIYSVKAFTDVKQHWASHYITFMAARELFSGIGKDLFSPNTAMTRAMFAQVLANIESVDLSVYRNSHFTDVTLDSWYAPAVEWATSEGIVDGYGNGLFEPEINISREQMAVMLAKYILYKRYELPIGSTTAFIDESTIASAYDGVKRLQAAGIVSGKPGNIYDPKGNATRAEAATIFARFIEVYLSNANSPDA